MEIADLFSTDAALRARVLRLVNSGAYGFPTRIETPWHAVMILGTQRLCDLALTTSIASLFEDIPGDLVSMESFWRHGVACGLAARALAIRGGEPNGDRFFVAGILHDIGRLVIYQQTPDLAREALLRCRATGTLLLDAERETVGVDHAALGAELGLAWTLPASLVESVGFHHAPRLAQRYPLEAALVHVGDVLAAALRVGTSGERLVPPLDPEAWRLLALPAEVIPGVWEEVERDFGATVRALRGDTAS